MAAGRGVSFRDSTITFALMIGIIALLAGGTLILLDPRSQAFWGTKLSDLGTAARAVLSQLPGAR